jgi:hypothetical protein
VAANDRRRQEEAGVHARPGGVMGVRATNRPDRAALAVHAAVERQSRGRPVQWVMVCDIASSLGLDDDVLEAAVARAIEKGWLIGEGEPPHSVCLAPAAW